MNEKLLRPYNPEENETAIYQLWEKSGFFRPETKYISSQKNCPFSNKIFSMVLPPPNVTGTLHMGHAVMLAIEDIMARFYRMRGCKTLWLPGTDHAAIATQAKVEKILLETEKKTRYDIGKEAFLEKVNKFAEESHGTIIGQIRKMGASVDWSREAFTLDEKRNQAVNEAFVRMYEAGLIYRGVRIVNWCPHCSSTLSDDEVEYKEKTAILYTFKYSKDFPVSISTTRPETKLGDAAVAVNPDDHRYASYVGKSYTTDLGHGPREIKIIADKGVDMAFGTGALGVTPAHSFTDYEMAQKNNLPLIKIIGEDGKMTKEAGENYAGLSVKQARDKLVNWLKEQGLVEKEEETPQNLSVCYRCGAPVEPLPSLQWFVNVNKKIKEKGNKSLKELMKKAVEKDGIKIIPERFEKIYFQWVDNLRDWCISRQIWYGHRLPVWYRSTDTRDEETFVGTKAPEGEGWKQDEDTLDTWFSSGLWTFSTLDANDLKTFHPLSVMETGYDILFFWVARMILMSTFLLGEIPFRVVYLHGLVRDKFGRKMSKSDGNAVDPLDMIAKYGADAVRMSLIIGVGPGGDIKLSEDKMRGYKHFTNKIWNISRFILAAAVEMGIDGTERIVTDADKNYLNEFNKLIKEASEDMENFRYHLAGEKLYHYIWHQLADIIIEECKKRIKNGSPEEKKSAVSLLSRVLIDSLKLLHPFMPFVTESVWQLMPPAWRKNGENSPRFGEAGNENLLMIASWPKVLT